MDRVQLTRACYAIQVPSGSTVWLEKGTTAVITQALGGSFTVQVPLAIVASVLIMAALNFLGLGAKPPDPTMGQIMFDGRPFMRDAPHFVIGPVILLALLLLSLNFLSDVLTERLDPVRRRAV